MEPEPRVEAFGHAANKNASAVDLMAKGKLRDALNALNQAIAAAPSYHYTYANRAKVFERMGLLPQAEADRKRAADLAAAAGYDDDEILEPAYHRPLASAPAPPHTSPPRQSNARSLPHVTLPSLPRIAFPTGVLIPVAFFVLLLAVSAGTLIGALAILRGGDSDLIQSPPGAVETPAGSTQTESPPPAPVPPAAAAGSTFSFSTLEAAWRARGITATLESTSEAFSGFETAPVDASLSGGGAAQLSIFFYTSREAPQQDWDLVPGSRPAPKAGRTLPNPVSIWWNANVIVVVRSTSGDITTTALDAFLNLSP